jgi:hypothetical protein
MKKVIFLAITSFVLIENALVAQCFFSKKANAVVGIDGLPCANTVVSAVPFLRITPDARGAAMGDVGIAVSTDANAMNYNTSKLVFAEERSAISATYTPWLRALGLNDMYLAYLSGYAKLNSRQAVGLSARFFSLGEINFTDENGTATGTGSPNELELTVGFAQKLSEKLSVGINGKFISSNLASGAQIGGSGTIAKIGYAGAADISLTYRTPIKVNGNKNFFTLGIAATNIGSKISYTSSDNRDYLPANLGIGTAYTMNLNEYNSLTFALDINKLMVPTPQLKKIVLDNGSEIDNPDFEAGGKPNVPDYKEYTPISAIFKSFSDAPGGFNEELKEYTFSVGAEYWYDKQFAIRAGYFNENKFKGGRKYLTLGLGLKYNVFGLNFSYLVPITAQRNPLDNTLRFSLLFDFGAMGADEE